MSTMTDSVVEGQHLMASGNLDDLRRVVHPQAVNREAMAEPPATRRPGPEGFHATALWLRAAFSDLAFAIENVVAQDDVVVTYGTMSGCHTGELVIWTPEGGIERAFPSTGRSFTVRQAHFHRVRDGLIAEHWAVRDDQGLAVQLGWVPPTPLYLARCELATRRARRRLRQGLVG